MANPASVFSSVTVAVVLMLSGVRSALPSSLARAIEKQPACALQSAPRGLVPFSSLEARPEGIWGIGQNAALGEDGAVSILEAAFPDR
jgi:hypothetical protein